MSDLDEVQSRLLSTMSTLLDRTQQATDGVTASRYASSANQLAEALAWLRAPEQPHGTAAAARD